MTGEEAAEVSRRVDIMRELLETTNHMLDNRGSVEALILGVEDRQALIEEFDAIRGAESYEHPLTPGETAEIQRLAQQILEKDKAVSALLGQYHAEIKKEISDNTRQQKVMGYVNNAISSSGSYMDYKK